MEPKMNSTPNPSWHVGQEGLQNLGVPAISPKQVTQAVFDGQVSPRAKFDKSFVNLFPFDF